MLLESLGLMLRGLLRIPPGASLRKADGPSTSSTTSIEDNDYITAIVDITVDDICIGSSPLSVAFEPNCPKTVQLKLDDINKEFNSIVTDVARDLCLYGFSVYSAAVTKKNKLVLLPFTDPVEFYLTKEKEVRCFLLEEHANKERKALNDKLIFINYQKSSLQRIEDKNSDLSKFAFKISPVPMQLKNADKTVNALAASEDSIARYRMQLSRIVRFANVDVGISQGDTQKTTVDAISSAINANSMSLTEGTAFTDFDDNIPVLPNRKGLGKVELVTDVPDADINKLADLDYWLAKLKLIMRFPGSYMDFTQNLDQTAVSLLRGDIRYSKLCAKVRTKIEDTFNDYMSQSKFSKYHPVFSLAQVPSSEDEDVISALDQYIDLTAKLSDYINEAEDTKSKLDRLTQLQILFGIAVNAPKLQEWFETMRKQIASGDMTEEQEIDSEIEGMGGDFDSGEDFEPSGDVEMNPDLEIEEPSVEEHELEGEFIEPQTT